MFLTLQVTSDITISKVFVADRFSKRLLGYMFRKTPHHEAILFEHCNSIHTFFMKFPIDVLFLDHKYQVIKQYEALKGGIVIFPVKGACFVLESQAGRFRQVKEGQILKKCILC